MAIQPEKREDLLNVATQFDTRIEFCLTPPNAGEGGEPKGNPTPIFVGIRSLGGWSIFFGEDPVLHFNSVGELRRLYFDGQKLAASNGQLVRLERDGNNSRVKVVEVALDSATEQSVLDHCLQRLKDCLDRIESEQVLVIGWRPAEQSGSLAAVQLRLRRAAGELCVAQVPNA